MHFKTFILYTLFINLGCNDHISYSANAKNIHAATANNAGYDTNPYCRINEIPLPHGFVRTKRDHESFGNWLLSVKLKKDKTVYKFDGVAKANQTAQFAVLDISIGDKDLQQCADAVMRLRAEYLYSLKKYEEIHFADNAGTVYQFSEPFTHKNLQLFLQKVFGRCGSASLAKQLKAISITHMEAGDVIIRGGFPGHAVIVMDVAQNKEGKKIYLLAQSYMPAQDIHVLVNPVNHFLSPWYLVNKDELIETPEYTFRKEELRRW